ncbi:hypothetical protein D9611_002298 [Ephemerocybe angulata]|uniref:Cytochrome b5 heme-binding domain-containing protein n=1 Tax=Ephemerocybe angulata TaxID=980116 RepID=A0A8H5FEG9_9AGAR|nr:hypothetical protein D9611_002298 [Tulosesus angulatus]
MSWFKEAAGGGPPPSFKEEQDKLTEDDPAIPGRKVSNKSANRPFLAYAEYRQRQEKLHEEWLEKKKARDEKIARGEKVGPLERDPTAVEEVGVLGLLKFLLVVVVVTALAGKFVTNSYTWDYEARWMQLKSWVPEGQEPYRQLCSFHPTVWYHAPAMANHAPCLEECGAMRLGHYRPHEDSDWEGGRLFSPEFLATYNGEDPGKPIYIAIDGDVYDVTKGAAYQKGGSYHILAGKEGARAFGTGCFKEHMTHDKRGLNKEERDGIEHWKTFYRDHKNYWKVGKVALPPIDPKSDPPLHCDPKRKAEELAAREKKAAGAQRPVAAQHEEL